MLLVIAGFTLIIGLVFVAFINTQINEDQTIYVQELWTDSNCSKGGCSSFVKVRFTYSAEDSNSAIVAVSQGSRFYTLLETARKEKTAIQVQMFGGMWWSRHIGWVY